MLSKVAKWGNSMGLRLPSQYLKELHISLNDSVECEMKAGSIVITPIKKKKRYTMKELLSKLPDDFENEKEVNWGKPEGGEVW